MSIQEKSVLIVSAVVGTDENQNLHENAKDSKKKTRGASKSNHKADEDDTNPIAKIKPNEKNTTKSNAKSAAKSAAKSTAKSKGKGNKTGKKS